MSSFTSELPEKDSLGAGSKQALYPDFSNIDPKTFGPMVGYYGNVIANDNNGADYLFKDKALSRSWGETLMFNAGMSSSVARSHAAGYSYIGGMGVGGAYGIMEGLRTSRGLNRTLKVNAVCNAIGKRGAGWGNHLGMLAICYTVSHSLLSTIRDKEDVYNHFAAAGIAGSFVRPNNPRAMVIGAVGGTALAGISLGINKVLRSSRIREYYETLRSN